MGPPIGCRRSLVWLLATAHTGEMILPNVDIASLRRQLDAEIERALETSDHLGMSMVSCHLQMARDTLGEPVASRMSPRPDSTATS